MKTTIDIPPAMLQEAMKHAGSAKKKEAVLAALDDYNRVHRQRELLKYMGTGKGCMTAAQLREMREARDKRYVAGR